MPSLLGTAAVRARLTAREFSFDAVVAQLQTLISDLRSIRAGADIRIPVAVALHGIEIEAGLHLELPWGVLRSNDEAVQTVIADALAPQGGVLVTSIPCAVEASSASGDAGPREVPPAKMRAFRSDLENRIQEVTLALLLVDARPPLSGVATRTVGITPFFGTGWGAGQYNPPRCQDRPARSLRTKLISCGRYPTSLRIGTGLRCRFQLDD